MDAVPLCSPDSPVSRSLGSGSLIEFLVHPLYIQCIVPTRHDDGSYAGCPPCLVTALAIDMKRSMSSSNAIPATGTICTVASCTARELQTNVEPDQHRRPPWTSPA